MATEPIIQTAGASIESLTRPYAPSWVDRLIAVISQLPGPAWLFYPVLLVVLILVNNGLQWMDGTVPLGTFDRMRTVDMVYPVYFLALLHYLNASARRAMENFRPVTALNEADFAHLLYKLQTVPARSGLVASMVGAAFAVVAMLSDPTGSGIFPRSSVRTIVFVCGTFLFAGAVLFIFIFYTVRQLHLVNQMYRLATRINLFNLKAIYAFSALTARSGLGLIFFAYFAFVGSAASLPDILNTLALSLFGMWLGTGIAAFLLPLQGIHRRLVAEKERKISEVNSRFTMVIEKLHQNIEAEHFDKIADINQALTSLIVEREQLEKISTWPWEKGTLRGFVTAIAVPIFLWLLTRLLERLFNF